MMPTPHDTQSADEIVADIRIDAPPARVFQALTDPAQVPQWWGQAGIYKCTRFEIDLRVGGAWRCSGTGADGGPFDIAGRILALDPPRLLAYTWTATWTGDATTSVRWELTPENGGTLVTIRHTGLAARPEAAQAYRGWPRMLGWIRLFVERGETVADRPAVSWPNR
jgi:uncharacterized protein YndB with AHSA1/START domain